MAFQMPSFLTRFLRPFSSATSMPYQADSLASVSFPSSSQRAVFANGCYWGTEHGFRKEFGNGKGLLDCRVGFTGGHTENPTYEETCSGRTGHAESILVVFDPEKVSYRQLVDFFFRMHDPTTLNRQGGDVGTQYRSAIFATSEEQLAIAEKAKEQVGKQWYPGKTITTEIAMLGKWYDASEKHQQYLHKNPWGYECPAHFVRKNFPQLDI